MYIQFAKKIMILIAWPGLLNFSTGIVNFVLSLPDWKVKFLEGSQICRRTVINLAHQKEFSC